MTTPRLLGFFGWRIALLAIAAGLPASVVSLEAVDATIPNETRHQAHRLLRELDRFLDHHPLLENDLRRDPKLVDDGDFLVKNPELQGFLEANPGVVPALQVEPRHFLHRALLREAGTCLRFGEVAQLDAFFATQPAIEREIVDSPGRIRERDFLDRHPALSDFLIQHPLLDRAFLPDMDAIVSRPKR
jgi:hypothetical protein